MRSKGERDKGGVWGEGEGRWRSVGEVVFGSGVLLSNYYTGYNFYIIFPFLSFCSLKYNDSVTEKISQTTSRHLKNIS